MMNPVEAAAFVVTSRTLSPFIFLVQLRILMHSHRYQLFITSPKLHGRCGLGNLRLWLRNMDIVFASYLS